MANLIYRETTAPDVPTATSSKGAPLTNLEIDGNFKSINNELGDIDFHLGEVDGVLGVLGSALLDADLGTTVQPYDATILKEADLGTTVQPYDATILKEADLETSVKTVNGESILGSGNLVIEGFTLAQAHATALSF